MEPTIFTISGVSPGKLSTMARPKGGSQLVGEMNALRDLGADVLVSLLGEREALELGLADEQAATESAGLRFVSFPITDRSTSVPQSFRSLAIQLAGEIADAKHVIVHCRMGIGRASMVAAATLMASGTPSLDAWASIRNARGVYVPDTPEQRIWVETAMAQP